MQSFDGYLRTSGLVRNLNGADVRTIGPVNLVNYSSLMIKSALGRPYVGNHFL